MRCEVRHAQLFGLTSSVGGTVAGRSSEVELYRFRKTATNAGDSRCVKDG